MAQTADERCHSRLELVVLPERHDTAGDVGEVGCASLSGSTVSTRLPSPSRYRPVPMLYGVPLDVLAATASTSWTPLPVEHDGSPERASTAVMSTVRAS